MTRKQRESRETIDEETKNEWGIKRRGDRSAKEVGWRKEGERGKGGEAR